jgi:serine/threonine protein kinase
VELRETGKLFAMKAMDKSVMLNRNKVHRVWAERDILELMDHPFLPTLYASFQVRLYLAPIFTCQYHFRDYLRVLQEAPLVASILNLPSTDHAYVLLPLPIDHRIHT